MGIEVENEISKLALIHPTAKIGSGNFFGPWVYVGPNVTIGDNNRFEASISIGRPAEKHGQFTNFGPVEIGSFNVVREYVTINGGTHRATYMGNKCVMLRGSHLSHDSILEDDVTVSCSVLIGGESVIMRGANLGLGAILHQYTVVGSWAMLGMGAVVPKSKEIRPGMIYVGNPARELKPNVKAIEKFKVDDEDVSRELERWKNMKKFRS